MMSDPIIGIRSVAVTTFSSRRPSCPAVACCHQPSSRPYVPLLYPLFALGNRVPKAGRSTPIALYASKPMSHPNPATLLIRSLVIEVNFRHSVTNEPAHFDTKHPFIFPDHLPFVTHAAPRFLAHAART